MPLPSPDIHPTPSKVLAEALEEARADMRKRMGKYPFDCDIVIEQFNVKECVLSILYQYPQIFIRDYTSLDAVEQGSLMYKITFLHNRAFSILTQPHLSQQEVPSVYTDIEETIDQKSYFNLFDTVLKTAVISRIENAPSSLDLYKSLEKYTSNLVESDQMDKEVPKVQIEKQIALKEYTKPAEEFISSSGISHEKIIDALNKAASLNRVIFEACKKSLPFEEAAQQKIQALKQKGDIFRSKSEEAPQPLDLSEIPLWRSRKGDGMPLDFVETHYGQWLSVFGAEQNRVFQDQIRAHDPGLIKGIHNQFREEGKGRKLHDFVKTRSARMDRELENVSLEDLKKNRRLAATLYSRDKRAAEANAAAPSHPVTRK